MWVLFQTFLKNQWLVVLRWISIAAGAFLLYLKIRQGGKDEVKQEDLQKTIDEIKVGQEVSTRIAGLSDTERQQLHDKWTR